jgi:hypothetical protein
MNKRVLSRSMFNRTARNKLYNKGGLPSVQKFQFGGVPKLPPVGMEDYKFLNDMIRSGNVQGLQSILQSRKPGRPGFGSLPFQMTNIARSAERRLNPAPSILDILSSAKDTIANVLGPTDKQKTISESRDKKDDSLTGEKLKELKIPEPGPLDTEIMTSTMPPKTLSQTEFDKQENPKGLETTKKPLSETNLSQTEFDKQENPKGLETEKKDSLIDTETLKNDLNAVSTEIKTKLEGTANLNYDPQGLGDEQFGLTNQEIVNDGVELSQRVKDLTKTYNPESKNPEEILSFNDKLLEITGAKDKDKPIQSLKERAKINKELYKDFFGEDPEDEKKIAALNLAFAGFAAAAGESPHALQNFAKGGMEFTKRTANSLEKKKAREEKINMFALTNALQDERSEKSWAKEMDKWERGIKYDWLKTVKGSNDQKDMVAARLLANKENVRAQILASKDQLADKLALQEKLTKFQVESRESIATLNAELKKRQLDQNLANLSFQEKKLLLNTALTKDIAASKNQTSMLNTLLSNFDDASTLAFFQTQQELGPDADISQIFGGDYLARVAEIAKTLPSSKQETKLTDSLEGFVGSIMKGVTQDPQKFSELLAQAKAAYPKYVPSETNPDQDIVLNFLKNQFDAIQNLGKSS